MPWALLRFLASGTAAIADTSAGPPARTIQQAVPTRDLRWDALRAYLLTVFPALGGSLRDESITDDYYVVSLPRELTKDEMLVLRQLRRSDWGI
ncbi:hypothetical protein F4778DRAFT_764000, partial [Xylariomycetidae sp. FL2044]